MLAETLGGIGMSNSPQTWWLPTIERYYNGRRSDVLDAFLHTQFPPPYHLWENLQPIERFWSLYDQFEGFRVWLWKKYHCPPVPTKDFYSFRLPDQCQICDVMEEHQRKNTMFLYYCRDYVALCGRVNGSDDLQTRILRKDPCPIRQQWLWATRKDGEPIVEEEIIKLKLGTTGYEMIL